MLFVLLIWFNTAHRTARLNADARESVILLRGFHEPERDGPRSFRWSTPDAQIRFAQPGLAGPQLLSLHIGAPPIGQTPADVRLRLSGMADSSFGTTEEARRYQLLLRPTGGDMVVQLSMRGVSVPPDRRMLGIQLSTATLRTPGATIIWPTPWQFLAPALLLLFGFVISHRIGLPPWSGNVVLLGGWLLVGFVYLQQPLLAHDYLTRLMIGAGVLLALSVWLLPTLERAVAWAGPPVFIRALWAAAILAVCIRFGGSLYPLFDAYDLSLNVGRFISTLTGDLVATNRSFEFRSGVTVYPSGPYVVVLPGLLIDLPQKLAVQAGIALIDGFAIIATGLLARAGGAGYRAARYATFLHAALPISLTSLWWGHTAQIFGQALMAPLAIALMFAFRQASGNRRAMMIAGILLAMALLTHIGVSILAVAWLGLAWLSYAVRRTLPPGIWVRFTAMLVIAGLIGLVFVYGPAAALKLGELTKVGEDVQESRYITHPLIARAFQISYYSIGWVLIVPALLLTIGWRWPHGGGTLIAAWIAAVAVFWVVEVVSGLQVRYMIFLAPLVCIVLGVLFARLSVRGTLGCIIAVACTAALLLQSALVWWQACWTNEQLLSMIPLLR